MTQAQRDALAPGTLAYELAHALDAELDEKQLDAAIVNEAADALRRSMHERFRNRAVFAVLIAAALRELDPWPQATEVPP